jgi:hypothetical protein
MQPEGSARAAARRELMVAARPPQRIRGHSGPNTATSSSLADTAAAAGDIDSGGGGGMMHHRRLLERQRYTPTSFLENLFAAAAFLIPTTEEEAAAHAGVQRVRQLELGLQFVLGAVDAAEANDQLNGPLLDGALLSGAAAYKQLAQIAREQQPHHVRGLGDQGLAGPAHRGGAPPATAAAATAVAAAAATAAPAAVSAAARARALAQSGAEWLQRLLRLNPWSEDALFMLAAIHWHDLANRTAGLEVFQRIERTFGQACMRCRDCCAERVRESILMLRRLAATESVPAAAAAAAGSASATATPAAAAAAGAAPAAPSLSSVRRTRKRKRRKQQQQSRPRPGGTSRPEL